MDNSPLRSELPTYPHHYYDVDPVNTISHKGEMHFKNSTFGVLTKGSTLMHLLFGFIGALVGVGMVWGYRHLSKH